MTVQLREKHRHKCNKYLKNLHDILTLTSDGSISFKTFDSDRSWLALITDLLEIPETQKYFDLPSIVRRCAFDMKRDGSTESHDLVQRINRRIRSITKNNQRYCLWTKITIHSGGISKPIRFYYKGYYIYIGPSLPKKLYRSFKYITEHEGKKVEPHGLCFAWINGEFTNDAVAGSVLSELLENFASILDFMFIGGMWSIIEAEPPRPKSLMRVGRLFFLTNEQHQTIEFHWYNPMFNPEPSSGGYKRLSEVEKVYRERARPLMKDIDSLPNDIKNKIWEVLLILHGGWESADKTYRLIRIWSGIEILFSDENANTKADIIIKRAAFSASDPTHRIEILNLIYKFRNKYIHQGRLSHSLDYLLNEATAQLWNSILWIVGARSDLNSHASLMSLFDMPTDSGKTRTLQKNANIAVKMATKREKTRNALP